MLRKRSRTIGEKQALMSDSHSLPSPTASSSCCNKPRSSALFPSPTLFVGFSPSSSSDSEVAMSPTSILETKNLPSIGSHFFSDSQLKKPPSFDSNGIKRHPWKNGDSKAIGLGIIDALNDEKSDGISPQSRGRMVLFGSQLKVQIPPLCPSSISPVGSPIEFGIKNKDSQLALLSPAWRSLGLQMPASSPRAFARSISMSEMELSEAYTCVISHGPNPKTTHIFDNCIVENTGDGFTPSMKGNSSEADGLSFCCACKKNLEQEKETFMFGGEKAFCSSECHDREMLKDDDGDDDGLGKLSKESSIKIKMSCF